MKKIYSSKTHYFWCNSASYSGWMIYLEGARYDRLNTIVAIIRKKIYKDGPY
jgi:hypothetical protein